MSEWEKLIPKPKSSFIRVKCPDCGSEQVVFSNIAMDVHCNTCSALLAESTGGKSRIKAEIIEVLE